MSILCCEPDCLRPSRARGRCTMHYRRFRKTLPLSEIQKQAAPGSHKKWLDEHRAHDGDSCLEWPFCKLKSGYGKAYYERRHTTAHRMMCILAHGEPPSRIHEAAHSCGNNSCCNPKHLRWATPVENAADKELHGTVCRGEKQGSSKLTEAAAREIIENRENLSQYALAKLHGITQSTVSEIRTGKIWKHILPQVEDAA